MSSHPPSRMLHPALTYPGRRPLISQATRSKVAIIKLANAGDKAPRLISFMFLTLCLIIDQTPSSVTLGHPVRLRCSNCERYCEVFSRRLLVTDMSAYRMGESRSRRQRTKTCLANKG